ncbi:MAG: MurR/RpiR family transcriptional regulator [Planctomycetota bacterium]
MSIQDLIAQAGPRLTPTERRIAEHVLEDSMLLAFGTVSDLAARAETSRPSIVRFATKLGFEGYTELQSWIRDGVSRRLSTPSARIRHPQDDATATRDEIHRSLQHVFETLDDERLDAMVDPMLGAANVWVLSGETSLAGARVLHSGLSMVLANVRLIDEHGVGRDLSHATDADCAVVFDFKRYRQGAVIAAQALSNQGVSIVAVTDGPLSPIASLADAWCELRVPPQGPFDSSLPAVAAAELLVSRTVSRLGDRARERLDRLEAMWDATQTFLEAEPRTPQTGS